jgi:outer membrane receptor protein involved in Fe transport
MGYVGSMAPLGDNANTSPEKHSEYVLFDFLLEYTRMVDDCEVTLFGAIDNAFETEYNFLVTDYGWGAGYYPAPERTFRIGAGVKF